MQTATLAHLHGSHEVDSISRKQGLQRIFSPSGSLNGTCASLSHCFISSCNTPDRNKPQSLLLLSCLKPRVATLLSLVSLTLGFEQLLVSRPIRHRHLGYLALHRRALAINTLSCNVYPYTISKYIIVWSQRYCAS